MRERQRRALGQREGDIMREGSQGWTRKRGWGNKVSRVAAPIKSQIIKAE